MAAHRGSSRSSSAIPRDWCLGGLSTDEIARAFLVPESTAAQRIVRAKRTLAGHAIGFALPGPEQMAHRLASVLQVIFLIFNEGYSATAGEDWMRPGLVEEALRLGRLLAVLVPDEPEVHGLLALMEIQASRSAARVGDDDRPMLLPDQDRRRWDRLLIRRGLESLRRAEALPAPIGPYTLQAAIAACHARAATVQDTDWARIAALYEVLGGLWSSPVVQLNRPSRWSSRRDRRPGWRSWMACWPPENCPTTHNCPRYAATCSPDSAGRGRRGRSSSVPPRSPGTRRSGRSS